MLVCPSAHLYNFFSFFYRSSQECTDLALNVLARGLEANQDSSELWLHYLKLYSHRSQDCELVSLARQALLYAPSYDLYCQVCDIFHTVKSPSIMWRRLIVLVLFFCYYYYYSTIEQRKCSTITTIHAIFTNFFRNTDELPRLSSKIG